MNYQLSFPIATVRWDGQTISALPESEIQQQLDILEKAGIREVMLAGYHEEESATFQMEHESRKVGDFLRSRGMKGAQHHGVAPAFTSPGTSQAEVIRRLKRCIDYTANLNADVLVLHTGKPLGFNPVPELVAAFEREAFRHGLETVMNTVADNLREAGEYAAACGIRIAIENIDGQEPLGDIEHLPVLLRQVDHPNVGFCLDTGHAWCNGTPIDNWLRELGDKLYTTHIHDNHGIPTISGERGDEHLPPGFGTISWRDVIAGLRDAGFQNTLNFESGPWPLENPLEGYLCAIRYWQLREQQADRLGSYRV